MEITFDDIKDVLLTMKNRTAKKKQIAFLLDCSEREVGNVIRRCPLYEIVGGSYGYFYWDNRVPGDLNIEERKILLAHINRQLGMRRRSERRYLESKKRTGRMEPFESEIDNARFNKDVEGFLDKIKEVTMSLAGLRNELMANLNNK